MKIIKIKYPLNNSQRFENPVVLVMGFFDGVHLGHQTVIRRGKAEAEQRNIPLAILTFDKLPAIVFKRFPNGVHYLTTLKRKCELFEQLGVDIVYVADFTAHLASLEPQKYVDNFLINLHPAVVVAGFDHTYGGSKRANMDYLPEYAKGRFDIVTVKQYSDGSGKNKVGSTAIRSLIDDGKVAKANQLLGYQYQTSGIIVHGLARGRTIGFPTANVDWDINERIPAIGVYAVMIKVDGKWHSGMASVGHNVTFGDHNKKTIEVNIFDFYDNIYGEHVIVKWISRLRKEVKFSGVDELVSQLHKDAIESQKLLKSL